jgi:protein-tyrosine-phosphatase
VQSLSLPELVQAMRVQVESSASRATRLEAVRGAASGRLVFVCYGNIMRSAFAAAYVQQLSPALATRTRGAGTHARPGKPAQDDAQRVAAEHGVDLSAHGATRLDQLPPAAADVIVCMDLANAARARRMQGVDPARVFLVGDALEDGDGRIVDDPYGQGEEATRAAFVRIREACEGWAALLDTSRT